MQVTSPTLLFLDEPTSGLDSASAFYVMDSVKQLAEHCRTVIAVIHQPSSEVRSSRGALFAPRASTTIGHRVNLLG